MVFCHSATFDSIVFLKYIIAATFRQLLRKMQADIWQGSKLESICRSPGDQNRAQSPLEVSFNADFPIQAPANNGAFIGLPLSSFPPFLFSSLLFFSSIAILCRNLLNRPRNNLHFLVGTLLPFTLIPYIVTIPLTGADNSSSQWNRAICSVSKSTLV